MNVIFSPKILIKAQSPAKCGEMPTLFTQTPSILLAPSNPGAITSMSLMYRHAVLGLFQ